MRSLSLCLLFAAPVFCEPALKPVTVVARFDQPGAEPAIAALKDELATIWRDAGVQVQWRSADSLHLGETFPDVVVVRFEGSCKMQPIPVLFDERGPLAETPVVDGAIQPYSTVQCDRVRERVRSAIWGGEFRDGDRILGKALGRVVAHEMHHILRKDKGHAQRGVAREALSGKQLTASRLRLE